MIWNKSDIRKARQAPLVIILGELGYLLRKLEHGNYVVDKFGSLIVKNNYWFWQENQQSGNTLDFFIKIENKSFMEAMKIVQNHWR